MIILHSAGWLHQSAWSWPGACSVFKGAADSCPRPLVLLAGTAKHTRHDVRRRFNLKEEPCGDCCVHCFCGPCAVCQVRRVIWDVFTTPHTPPLDPKPE